MLCFCSWGHCLFQDLSGRKHPSVGTASALRCCSAGTCVFSCSFCQNPEGSWIPEYHLWVCGDVAVCSDRPSSPHCHLAGKWESCKFLFFHAFGPGGLLTSGSTAQGLKCGAGSQCPWFLLLPYLAPCCAIKLSPPCLPAAVFSFAKHSPPSQECCIGYFVRVWKAQDEDALDIYNFTLTQGF